MLRLGLQILSPCQSTPLFFVESRLEIRDKNLKDEEFQIDKVHPNPTPALEPVTEEDLNIMWIDGEDSMGRAKEKSDDEEVGYMFRSQSVLDQKFVDRLVRRYNIPSFYMRRAPKYKEYMFNTGDKEIAIFVAHLETGLRFSLHPFSIWFIKNFLDSTWAISAQWVEVPCGIYLALP